MPLKRDRFIFLTDNIICFEIKYFHYYFKLFYITCYISFLKAIFKGIYFFYQV